MTDERDGVLALERLRVEPWPRPIMHTVSTSEENKQRIHFSLVSCKFMRKSVQKAVAEYAKTKMFRDREGRVCSRQCGGDLFMREG